MSWSEQLRAQPQDFTLALQLVQEGSATLQWGPAFVAGPHQGGDAAAVFFGSALKVVRTGFCVP